MKRNNRFKVFTKKIKNRGLNPVLIVIIVFIVLICGFKISKSFTNHKSVMTNTVSQKQTIIIDPGHGGFDGGAVGVNDIVEKDLNLQIALKLSDILKINGYNIILTRDGDYSTADEGLKTIREKKKSDMKNRLKLIKENPNGIFVSIHQNKFEKNSPKGTQVFYSTNNTDSERLAGIIQKNCSEILQPWNERMTKPSGRELYLLYYAKIPAVLVECGFISNYDEAKNLTDEEYQEKLAFVIFLSINDFINNKDM